MLVGLIQLLCQSLQRLMQRLDGDFQLSAFYGVVQVYRLFALDQILQSREDFGLGRLPVSKEDLRDAVYGFGVV
ncbi:MAG TPA: hypothetical protein DIT13_09155 [Verrucomicrobiales bacterium]|nr:hypothetical protein [Verrucomicrobiales bacterium]